MSINEFINIQKQLKKDRDINRKIAKQKGIKIWTWDEIKEEYGRTGEDCNYVALELVGKPQYWISPMYDGWRDGEYVKVNDLRSVNKDGGEKSMNDDWSLKNKLHYTEMNIEILRKKLIKDIEFIFTNINGDYNLNVDSPYIYKDVKNIINKRFGVKDE